MKYAVEMGSSAVMYISNSIKNGSGIQKLMEEGVQIHKEIKVIS
jgi:hypothetical protein